MDENYKNIRDYCRLAKDFFYGKKLERIQDEIRTRGVGKTEIALGNMWKSILIRELH